MCHYYINWKFASLLIVLLAGGLGVLGQELPTEPPTECDGSFCEGCTPYKPKADNKNDFPCGFNDIYAPVPVFVLRNDTSPGQELVSTEWICYPCCSLGCGFNQPSNTCAYRAYDWKENEKFGCTSCKGKDVLVPNGGTVKTSFADRSTEAVYQVINQPYGVCAAQSSVQPSPKPQPSPEPEPEPEPETEPSPEPLPSPEPVASPPPPASPVVSSPPIPTQPAQAPEPELAPEPEGSPSFEPVPISTSTEEPPSPPSAGFLYNHLLASVCIVGSLWLL